MDLFQRSNQEDLFNAFHVLMQLDIDIVEPALKLIRGYVDTIVKNPWNLKFRYIYVYDANFYNTVWQLKEARAFLRAVGMKEHGDFFIYLYEKLGVDIRAVKALIEPKNRDQETEKACEVLRKELLSIGSIDACDVKFIEENQKRSKEVFGLMRRANFQKAGDKFQPCQDEIDMLRSMPKGVALCNDLRRASWKSFYQILYPEEDDVKGLGNRDSIFHLHKDLIKNDETELKDLNERAECLAEVVKTKRNVTIHILDGHGRMLVCLLRALDRYSALEQVGLIRLFEIDEVVHKYHKLALPDSIEKLHHTVIDHRQIPYSGVIYLNFCSIPSMAEYDWTSHFEDQTIDNWVYGCCKENVLEYIWKAVNPPYSCTVMVSCVIRQTITGNRKYFAKISKDRFHITGLGFLHLLRCKDLFDAEIISIRSESEIIWEKAHVKKPPKRCPLRLRSGGRGCPFVTLIVRPKDGYQLKMFFLFKKNDVTNLQEEELQKGARVRVKSGKYAKRIGVITSRTKLQAKVAIDGTTCIGTIHIDKLEKIILGTII